MGCCKIYASVPLRRNICRPGCQMSHTTVGRICQGSSWGRGNCCANVASWTYPGLHCSEAATESSSSRRPVWPSSSCCQLVVPSSTLHVRPVPYRASLLHSPCQLPLPPRTDLRHPTIKVPKVRQLRWRSQLAQLGWMDYLEYLSITILSVVADHVTLCHCGICSGFSTMVLKHHLVTKVTMGGLHQPHLNRHLANDYLKYNGYLTLSSH